MHWKELYAARLTTPAEAVKRIQSQDYVVLGHCCGEPAALVRAMVDDAPRLKDVEVMLMVPMGPCAFCAPGMQGHFKVHPLFLGGNGKTRGPVNEGEAAFTPIFFHKVPDYLRARKVNVALIQVSLPDEHGYCSLGVAGDYTKAAAEVADLVIAQVNRNCPRTLGDCFVHVSEMDWIVESNDPLPELDPPKIGDVERKIGEYCALMIQDGDTLQLGIGAIPDAVLLFLKDKKDLGIHSEMFSDGVVELFEAGVITNRRKSVNRGRMIVTFLMGTRRLYDFVHNNPAVGLYPVDYVNDPMIIAQNDNLVSINSCLQVDLMGQVVAGSVGDKHFSGIGGQADFVRGASYSKGGRSIIAMASTAAKGTVSRIVADLDSGSIVTTSHYDVDAIITEYGIAQLKNKSYAERARALIAIAHPDFRDSLQTIYAERFGEPF